RDSLKVLDVYRSNLYENIALTVLLPSDHIMLICGLYNPPKHSYRDINLMNYIMSFVDYVLNNTQKWLLFAVAMKIVWTCKNLRLCLAGISWLISPRQVTRAWITV
ncbi:unnamed protein product, partial [Porites evermanni]